MNGQGQGDKQIRENSPVWRAVRAFGGWTPLAVVVGTTEGAVRKWDRARAKGGCGGQIPSDKQAIILREAEQRGLELGAEDLIAEAWG